MGLIPYKNEENLDWSDASNVERMWAAIKDVEGKLGKDHPAIIGGQRIEPDGGSGSAHPATPPRGGGRTAAATKQEADMALEAATAAFEHWSRTGPEARARVLLRAAAIMKRRKFELLAWEVFEGGKPWSEADAQVAEGIAFLAYSARALMGAAAGVGAW